MKTYDKNKQQMEERKKSCKYENKKNSLSSAMEYKTICHLFCNRRTLFEMGAKQPHCCLTTPLPTHQPVSHRTKHTQNALAGCLGLGPKDICCSNDSFMAVHLFFSFFLLLFAMSQGHMFRYASVQVIVYIYRTTCVQTNCNIFALTGWYNIGV